MSETNILKLKKHDNPSTNTNQFDIENYLNQNWNKIDEGIGQDRERITVLETDNTTNKQDISNIKKEQTTQNNELEELRQENQMLKNMFPTGETEEAEYLSITDSAEASLKELKVSGNSWQETRSGKNKFDLNSISEDASGTLDIYETGIGATWRNTRYTEKLNMNRIKAGTYKYCFKLSISNSNYSDSLVFYDKDNKVYTISLWNNGYETSEITFEKEIVAIQLFINSNKSQGNWFKVEDFMLIPIDSTVSTDYEPYGVMPSPEYPSPIQNVEGNVEVEVTGKNLFDNTLKNYGLYGMKATTIPTGIRMVSDTDVGTSDYKYGVFTTINLSNYVGKTVRMKATIKSNSNLRGTYNIGICNSKGTNRIVKEGTTTSGKIISFVVPEIIEEQKYLAIWLYANAGGTGATGDYVDYTNVIITIDNEDMTYEPYQSQTITFPLKEGQKMYEGSTMLSNGINNTRAQIVLDGSSNYKKVESMGTNNYGYTWFTFSQNAASDAKKGAFRKPYCNVAIGTDNDNYKRYQSSLILQWSDTSASFCMALPTSIVGSTKDEINTWLQQNPITVEYELAEEEVEPYTEEQQSVYNELQKAKTYKNTTNIFSTNETSPSFKATYYKDLETYQRQQDDRITALEELLSTTTTSAMLLDNMQTDLESEV